MSAIRSLLFVFFILLFSLSFADDKNTESNSTNNNTSALKNNITGPIMDQNLKKMGQAFLSQMQREHEITVDIISQHYISELGKQLQKANSFLNHRPPLYFFLVNHDEVNAFALPGDAIGVNVGLVDTTRSESELAAVLAHEMTHVSQHHIAQQLIRSRQMRIPLLLSSVAAIALGSLNPELGAGAFMGSMAGFQQSAINFTRAHEEEADRLGIKNLYQAHFDPNSMANFFSWLQNQERYYSHETPSFLLTHPVSLERITDSANRAMQYPHRTYISSLSYYLVRMRLQILNANNIPSLFLHYQEQCKAKPSQAAACYGAGFSAQRLGKFEVATSFYQSLIKMAPKQITYLSSMIENYLESGQYSKALNYATQMNHYYPQEKITEIYYAQTLLLNQQYEEARRYLNRLVALNPENLTFLSLLARAQALSGKTGYAYLTLARGLKLIGKESAAQARLKTALSYAKNDQDLQARIKVLRNKE